MADAEVLEVLVRMRGGRQFRAEAIGAASGIDRVEKSERRAAYASQRLDVGLGGLRTRLGFVGRSAAALAGIAGFGGLIKLVHDSVNEFAQHQQIAASTAAVLRSTGGAANIAAEGLDANATRLSKLSGVDDEVIAGGQNMLLTFRQIRNEAGKGNDIFTQAADAALNMSRGFKAAGKELSVSDAALQIGKALNDPIKGYGRLQRIGVTFTKSQIDQIKVYDALGDRIGAQKVILGELNNEFRGQAAAYGKTLPGALERAQTSFHNLEETIGGALAPSLTDAADAAAGFIDQMQNGTGAGGQFVDVLKDVWSTTKDVFGVIKPLVPYVVALGGAWATYKLAVIGTNAALRIFEAFQLVGLFINAARAIGLASAAMVTLDTAMIANPVGLVVAGIALLAAGLVYAYNKVEWFHKGVDAVWHFIQNNWKLLGTAIMLGLTGPVGAGVFFVLTHLDQIVGFVSAMPGRIESAAHGMWDGIAHAFKASMNWIIGAWDSLHFSVGGWKIKGPFGVSVKLPKVTVGMPQIPMLAQGGDVARAGAVIVGDQGPELLHLEQGARVEPLHRHSEKQIIQLMVDGRVLAQTVVKASADARARS